MPLVTKQNNIKLEEIVIPSFSIIFHLWLKKLNPIFKISGNKKWDAKDSKKKVILPPLSWHRRLP